MGLIFTRINDQSATIMKGFYMDTPQNRKLGRVGKKYDDTTSAADKAVDENNKGLSSGDYKAISENPGKEVVQYAILSRIKSSEIFQGLSESEFKEFAKLLSSPANSAFSQIDLKTYYAKLAKSKSTSKSENKDLTGQKVKVKTFSGSMVEGIVHHHLAHDKNRVVVYFEGGGDGIYYINELGQAKEERKSVLENEVEKIPNFTKVDKNTAENFLKVAKQQNITADRISVKEHPTNGALIIYVDGKDLNGRSFYSSKYDQMSYPQQNNESDGSKRPTAKPPKEPEKPLKGTVRREDPSSKDKLISMSIDEAKVDIESHDNGSFTLTVNDDPKQSYSAENFDSLRTILKNGVGDIKEVDDVLKNVYLKGILNKVKTFKPEKPQIYHETYSSAVTSVRDYIESQGYTVNEDDWFREVTDGGKPKVEETKRSSIGLIKDGKESKKYLNIQVYRIAVPKASHDSFELNWYIN